MFDDDRKIIENKYHIASEPFDPYNRMAYHGYDFDETTGQSDEEIRKGLRKLSEETAGLAHPVRKAEAVRYALEHTRIDAGEHDYFPGIYSLNRLANDTTVYEWQRNVFDVFIPGIRDEMRRMNETGAAPIWADFDHVVPDWDSVLTLGFTGLMERAESYRALHERNGVLTDEKRAFFDGINIVYSAIIGLMERIGNYAGEKAKACPGGKAEKIARCMKSLTQGAPKNIYEAMTTIYIYFIASECFDSYQVRSLGNGLDNSLYGFYARDIKNGTFTQEEVREITKYFLFQWSAIGNYWGQPLYLGGTNKDGSTKFNALSRLILDVYDEIGIYNPKIQIKVGASTPRDVLDKVLDMVRRGRSSFVFVGEYGMRRAMMSYGATADEAREADIRGCYETGVRANEVSTVTGYVNAAKAVRYVFTNGIDEVTGEIFGQKTGEATGANYPAFDDFYGAVLRQWSALIEKTIAVANEYEKYLSFINPANMYSATVESALKKGEDAYQSGVKFNNSAILNCGFATLVDSVMSVKELVYDRREVTLEEMGAALEADWIGYEQLRAKALKTSGKYGNDDRETDEYAAALAEYFANSVNNRPNARGGVYKATMHTAMQFVWEGEKTGATPDGRKRGDEIAKNGSPSVGADREGVTALIESALKLTPSDYHESFCVDIMLHPSACEGSDGLAAMRALVTAYVRGGGMAVQFNVFDEKTLRDAQKHPEKYRNLQVRVCGWNVLWNNLSEAEQNAYILRAKNSR